MPAKCAGAPVHSSTTTCYKILFLCYFTVGFSLLAVNGEAVSGKLLPNGTDAMSFIKDPNNYPVSLKFGRTKLSTNEKIMLASMFHP